jgi:hypothetical protein
MEGEEVVRREREPLDDIEARLQGRVFHVTSASSWESIKACGAIQPNSEGLWTSPFGSRNGFFRKRGFVSVFDYRPSPTEEVASFRGRCHPLYGAARPGREAIVVAFLSDAAICRLEPWDAWSKEQAWDEMVVPLVEAGHPGPINLSDVVSTFRFRRVVDPADDSDLWLAIQQTIERTRE